MNVPPILVAGDSWAWTAEYGDYPATSWAAVAYFENAAGAFSVTSSASGTAFAFAKAAASTSVAPGRYLCRVRLSFGSDVVTVNEGWVEVERAPSALLPIDHRSWARRTLDAVEAFIEGNASTAQQSIQIGGRSLSRWAMPDLLQLRNELRAEVRREEQGSDAGLGRDIRVRHGQP